MKEEKDFVITVFGASGDLASRKLFPALYKLFSKKMINDFAIMALSRHELEENIFRENIFNKIKSGSNAGLNDDSLKEFCSKIYFYKVDSENIDDYKNLTSKLESLCNNLNISNNYLFYLSTPPIIYPTIIKNIALSNLHKEKKGNWRRLIIEKPYGEDLQSAMEIEKIVKNYYKEDQIYRLDHYLGKETVQNVLVFRFANEIFEPVWNRNYIDYVEITAVEDMGILDRGGYYDKAGALRDMVQNHLLQILGIMAMEPPAKFTSQMFRNEVFKVIESLRPLTDDAIQKNIIRGQYTDASTSKGEFKSYREEKDVDPDSKIETYVAMKIFIDNWRWKDVPFFIRTGKAMPTKVSEIVIHFKQAPGLMFDNGSCKSNQLIIRLLPDEGFLLEFGIKAPGEKYKVKPVAMDFRYQELAETDIPDAYETLLLDCIAGDSMLFSRSDIINSSWKFVEPILELWEKDSNIPLYGYPAGTWGPKEAEQLMADGDKWVNPCRNLTNSDHYCLL